MTDVAVLAAFREELRALSLDEPSRWEPLAKSGGYVRHGMVDGVKVGLAVTGVGAKGIAQRARGALEALLPGITVIAGFAGGLRPELGVGSVVLSPRLCQGGSLEASAPLIDADAVLTAAMEQLLSKQQLLHGQGICITMQHALTSPGEKRRLGKTSGALVVDMESYWVGMVARELGIPFVALRAVLDPVAWTLPAFVTRAQGQQASNWLGPALAYALSHPTGVLQLFRLWRASRQASQTLARATRAALPTLAKAVPVRS